MGTKPYGERHFRFETLQLHAGQETPDPATGARAVPIYQTSSLCLRTAPRAADRFALREEGNIYSRLTNPTVEAFEKRMAALEGGVAAVAVASGAAAVTCAVQNVALSGGHVVAAKNLYGGTYNLLAHTLPDYGITTTFVDPLEQNSLQRRIRENTKALYIEALGNPNCEVTDIEAVAEDCPRPWHPPDDRRYICYAISAASHRIRGGYRNPLRHKVYRRDTAPASEG